MAFTLPEGVVLNAWQSPIYPQSYIIEGRIGKKLIQKILINTYTLYLKRYDK